MKADHTHPRQYRKVNLSTFTRPGIEHRTSENRCASYTTTRSSISNTNVKEATIILVKIDNNNKTRPENGNLIIILVQS